MSLRKFDTRNSLHLLLPIDSWVERYFASCSWFFSVHRDENGTNANMDHLGSKKSQLDLSLFFFLLYLNLNRNLSKITKKPKDLNIFTNLCHYYPTQNLTHPKPDPTNPRSSSSPFFSINSSYSFKQNQKVSSTIRQFSLSYPKSMSP